MAEGWQPAPSLELTGSPSRSRAIKVSRSVRLAAVTDWAAWHTPYDDPDSPLSQRLRAVRADGQHARGKVDAEDVQPEAVQVAGDPAGPAPDVGERS